ncbi:MAG: sulfatase-like hydrolase/transferase, partial [Planctomycetota bacterium]
MNRRGFLKYLAAGAAGLFSTSYITAMGKSAEKKPNVLFIAIDDMNDWTTLFHPKNPIKTPNLVRLAKRGMFFSKAYCVVPACTPSRTAILTGYSPMTSGSYTNDDFLRDVVPDAVTL